MTARTPDPTDPRRLSGFCNPSWDPATVHGAASHARCVKDGCPCDCQLGVHAPAVPVWEPCPLGVCAANKGHDGTCEEASGWGPDDLAPEPPPETFAQRAYRAAAAVAAARGPERTAR